MELKQQDMLSQLIVDGSDESKFCMLLGAGASLSSGIPTAGEMVDEWKEDLRFIESKNKEVLKNITIHDDKFEEFYKIWKKQRAGNLINPSDYSLLMEYFRPTAALRQAFIEDTIDNKYPGFGYLYLSMLIDAGYFNVMFTTNFDNLINDALYRFVDSRPLVCSFDSNLSSIRIASRRPKIIKLHGDYLFNNLKNTSSELRNLSNNMEDKFKQFCQEYGLIVIGYSGGDDSIMDIVRSMLKNDEYLKMGLHWCVRSEADIPKVLKRTVGLSDRLHFYKIDSFDILMSDICERANLDLPNDVTDPVKSKTIEILTDSAKAQTNTNLSIKIVDDANQIVQSLQNLVIDNDLLIKGLHMRGKKIQMRRFDYDTASETIERVEECVKGCEKLLKDSNNLSIIEVIDVHLILGVAKISQAKVSINTKDKISLYQEIIELLSNITSEVNSLSTSRLSSDRQIYCRLYFNISCVYGLIASEDKNRKDDYCKKSAENLNKLVGIYEGKEFLDKVAESKESDLEIFKSCTDFKTFYSKN